MRDEDAGRGVAGRARPAPRRWWMVAAVGLLAVGAGAYAVVDERARQAELERHADVPGVVGTLAEPLEEAWRGSLGMGVVQTDDLVLVAQHAGTADGAGVLSARDVATGEERWRIEGPDGVAGECAAEVAGASGPLLLCALPVQEDRDGQSMPFFDWRLVDPASGDVTRLPAVTDGSLVYGQPLTSIDGDLVYVDPVDGTSRALVRVDLAAEEVLWQTPLPALSEDPAAGWVDGLVASGDLVVVRSRAGAVLLDHDGQVLHELARDAGVGPELDQLPVLVSPTHGVGIWTSATTGTWFAPDGAPTATLEGRSFGVDVVGDDETVTLVQREGVVVGVDVTSGAELWSER
ncbi:MAG: PQQ-binding-like beta-propeller repeat protein [Actinotalea sp.]|nr:PQQ-binding-like beta-propeller repeat protein [Actinotalea sp.]